MPRRILTAYWLMAYGFVLAIRWLAFIGMEFFDGRNPFDESSGLLAVSVIMLAVMMAVFIIAGRWIRDGNINGHYLAVVVLILSLLTKILYAFTAEALLLLGFLALLANDLRRARSTPGFSLTVEKHLLADFWPMPWLVSGLLVAMFGFGEGFVPAAILHVFSPIAVFFIHRKLQRHPGVDRSARAMAYKANIAAWTVAYLLSLFAGFVALQALGGLAMQGAGR